MPFAISMWCLFFGGFPWESRAHSLASGLLPPARSIAANLGPGFADPIPGLCGRFFVCLDVSLMGGWIFVQDLLFVFISLSLVRSPVFKLPGRSIFVEGDGEGDPNPGNATGSHSSSSTIGRWRLEVFWKLSGGVGKKWKLSLKKCSKPETQCLPNDKYPEFLGHPSYGHM